MMFESPEARIHRARRGGVSRGPANAFLGLAAAAVVAIAAGAAAGAGEQRPFYEIAASGEKEERGAAARVELDAAIPLWPETWHKSALFLQPGLVFRAGRRSETCMAARSGSSTGSRAPAASSG